MICQQITAISKEEANHLANKYAREYNQAAPTYHKITFQKDVLEWEIEMTKPELEVCIDKYGTALYSFCRYLTGNMQEAEDLYQDTFLKAIELNEKIDARQNPKSYLLAVAVRIWKNRKRKYAWRKRIVDERVLPENRDDMTHEQTQLSPEEQLLSKEEIQAVRKAVQKLPERLQVIVLLYYMENLSVAQVASVVKIPKGTVKSRLHQARKLLEKELEVVFNEKRS